MQSTVYKFSPKFGILDNKIFNVRDYFEYYTTGVESIIKDNPEFFKFTTRKNTERPEQIMYDLFNDENLGDTFIAINNQNYLWATPFDLDSFHDTVEFRMNYIKNLMKDRLNDPGVYDIMEERITEELYKEDDKSRAVIVPDLNSHRHVNKKIEEYFKSRKVQ